jgi:hypothetical protein
VLGLPSSSVLAGPPNSDLACPLLPNPMKTVVYHRILSVLPGA